MNNEQYLKRIEYSGSTDPSIEVLTTLQKAHLFYVPFENLDIHSRLPIELHVDKIYKKIVDQNRGGFCYELNGLFYELLLSLKFNARRISARVHTGEDKYSPEYDHLTIVVKIGDNDYITDVGFGEFIIGPLQLVSGVIQKDVTGDYLVDKYDSTHFRINKIMDGKPVPEFIFEDRARDLSEFKPMCHYHQTNPNSHFMKKRLISLPTETGRITIAGNTLKIKENDLIQESELRDETDYKEMLWNLFKVKLD